MNNWFSILKESRQVVDTKTNLNVISEPLGEEDNCCEEVKMKYNRVQKPKSRARLPLNDYPTKADKLDCDEFKSHLKQTGSYRKNGWVKRIVDEWEACENE